MRITFVTRKFGNVERNSHCDVLHITPIRIARLFLDCNGDFAIKAYCCMHIGLYRDVWIAASVSSRTRLATLTGAMCKTSQCELRSIRVHSGMLKVIRIVTYYTLPPLESPTSSLDCNGVLAIKAYVDIPWSLVVT